MFHISDCKKYKRCPILFYRDTNAEKKEYRAFVRLDEEINDLVQKKLHIEDSFFLGERGDDAKKALDALDQYDWLIKARFEYHNLRVKVPFLHRNGDGWDLYFLYVGLYPHADDVQYHCNTIWVLEHNNIKIKEVKLIHLNANYVREDALDIEQLFVISDHFYNGHHHPTIPIKDAIKKNKVDLSEMLDAMEELSEECLPEAIRTTRCAMRTKCTYYDECFPNELDEPDNSILTLMSAQYRYAMKQEGIHFLKDADISRIEGSRQQYAQIMADDNGGVYVDRLGLQSWMDQVQYPITFLDFEWERFAIPPYKGMKPFDVMPFEYSIHIMEEDGSLKHHIFLETQDPRKEMVESLIRDIPKTGSIIAYNAEGAEKIRIQELAHLFPEYKDALEDMIDRMLDLQLPFEKGTVYDVRMRGQWSLKTIMAMMDDPGYETLDIDQGMEAVYQWRHLDKQEEAYDYQKIKQDLIKYCGMDTYAMSVVYQWLKTLL